MIDAAMLHIIFSLINEVHEGKSNSSTKPQTRKKDMEAL
jgi:hypothetical protein